MTTTDGRVRCINCEKSIPVATVRHRCMACEGPICRGCSGKTAGLRVGERVEAGALGQPVYLPILECEPCANEF